MKRIAIALAVFGATVCGRALASPPLEDYGKLPAVEQMQLSPKGDLLAYVSANGDQRQVRVAKVGGDLLFAVNVGDLKLRDLAWMGEGHILVEAGSTIDTSVETPEDVRLEIDQSTVIDAATGKMLSVFHEKSRVFHATFGYYGYAKSGGREYGYFGALTLGGGGNSAGDFNSGAGYITHGHSDLYRVDLDTGRAEEVAGGSERLQATWLVTAQGDLAAHSEYEIQTGAWRLFADLDDKHLMAQADNSKGDVNLVGLGRTPGSVVVQRPGDGGKGDWQYLEYTGGAAGPGEPLFAGLAVSRFLNDPVTGLLIGGTIEGDDPAPLLFDPALQIKFDKVRRAFKGERVDLVSNSDNFQQMVVLTTGPGDSGTYFLIDLAAGKASAIGWNYPSILQGDVAQVRTLTYKAADGQEIQALLTLPPGLEAKHLPVVVMPHGGPEARDYMGFDYWAQAFASKGYAVLQPNFRGSDGFGKAFRDAGFGEWGRKMQTDLSDGLAELERQGLVDPKRACIVGASYGGYAALAGVTVQQGLYRCAVSVGGISELNDMLKWDAAKYGFTSGAMRYEHQFLGVNSNDDQRLEAYSPRHFADRADAPILLIYGQNDTVVDPAQSRQMASALKGAHKPVEVLQLPGEDHWMSRQATRTQMVEASVDFVVRNDPPN